MLPLLVPQYNYTEDSILDPQTYTLGPAFNVELVLGLMDLVNDIMQVSDHLRHSCCVHDCRI